MDEWVEFNAPLDTIQVISEADKKPCIDVSLLFCTVYTLLELLVRLSFTASFHESVGCVVVALVTSLRITGSSTSAEVPYGRRLPLKLCPESTKPMLDIVSGKSGLWILKIKLHCWFVRYRRTQNPNLFICTNHWYGRLYFLFVVCKILYVVGRWCYCCSSIM